MSDSTIFEDAAALHERIAAHLGVKSDGSVALLVAGIKRQDDGIRGHLLNVEKAIRGMASAAEVQKALQRP